MDDRDRPELRILYVSRSLPPRASGSAIVAQNLLRNFTTREVVVLGQRVPPGEPVTVDRLPHRTLSLPMVPTWMRGQRYIALASVPLIVAMGLFVILRSRANVIVVVFPDESYLLASYLMSLLTRRPLVPYFHDLYLENAQGPLFRRLATWLQRAVFRRARFTLAINAGVAGYHSRVYGIRAEQLLHCINEPIPPARRDCPPLHTPIRIGFSGSIYDSAVGPLRDLCQAIRGNDQFELRYFTPSSRGELERLGLWEERTRLDFFDRREDLLEALEDCDILYLPLTFDAAYLQADELATAFPTKALEYLLSGRPILVHCPAHYFLAKFFRETGSGLVIDQPGAQPLTEGLARLRSDAALREELVYRSLQTAARYRGANVADRLRELLTA